MEYGSVVWCSATNVKCRMQQFHRVQRVALLSTAGTMKSTPTEALECLFGLEPISTRIQLVALQTMHRLKLRNQWLGWYGRGNYIRPASHMDVCERLSRKVPEMELPCDKWDTDIPCERNFCVKIQSSLDWIVHGHPEVDPSDWTCYTDGSRHGGNSGAGFIVMSKSLPGGRAEGLIPLGTSATVYQAELMALIGVGHFLTESAPLNVRINIFVDSNTLESLTSQGTTSSLVWEAFQILNELGKSRSVQLNWIPAHRNYEGNELADELAKRAAEMCPVGPQPVIPLSPCVVKLALREWARNSHKSEWQKSTKCKNAKNFLREPYEAKLGNIIKMSRGQLRLLVQIVTGHSILNSHLFKMGLVSSPLCDCEVGEETSAHFLGECDKYILTRLLVLGRSHLTTEELSVLPFASLARFIVKTGRFDKGRGRHLE